VAPSLGCWEGALRLRDQSSQLPPWRFARCEAQRCQVAAKCSCAAEPFLFWIVAVWNASADGSPALKEIPAITPSASLKDVAMISPAPTWVLLPPMHSADVNTFGTTITHIQQSISTPSAVNFDGETPPSSQKFSHGTLLKAHRPLLSAGFHFRHILTISRLTATLVVVPHR
jgi:hypothetical protein